MISGIFLAILILSLPSPVFGNDPFVPNWKTSCSCEGTVFDLSFTSQSGDLTEDDMTVKFISSRSTEFTIPIEQSLYSKRSIASLEKNICEDIGGFKLKKDRVLLWLSRNNRPCWDQLSLILIDLKALTL